ncbi:phosphatidylglycerophosphatase A, partial [Aquitalea sp. S1-19]|nr:phosphatidylglycerophosphatase A [Aquitalea sp. S1-19]
MTILRKPDWAFVCSHPAHFLAFGFGSGLAPKAPGTWGSLVALPLYALLLA